MKIGRNEMMKMLESGVTKVLFIKKDGSKREMLCTRDPELLPKIEKSNVKQRKKKSVPEHLISVFDVEKNDWRMVNLKTLISAEPKK